ncbi:MAG: DUF2752 domain-containing protein [Clostridia bacterium]|nr:DUF2752 domain-containing protein [Clostridia bacterium]
MKKWLEEVFARIKHDFKYVKWVFIGIPIYWAVMMAVFHDVCMTTILTGFPCPGCGMTRACVLLLRGHVMESIHMHPMVIPWLIFGIYAFMMHYLLDKKIYGWKIMMGLLLAAMLGVYVYRMLTIFPNEAPMIYTPTPWHKLFFK